MFKSKEQKKRDLHEKCSATFPDNFKTQSIPSDTGAEFLVQTDPVPTRKYVALGGRKKRRTRKPKKQNKKSKKHHKKHSYKKH